MNLYTSFCSSPIGPLKLQCTDRFIKTISFAEDNPVQQTGSHKLLQACTRQLDEYFAGRRRQFHLPLNQDGTDFQVKVWDLLLKIPFGKTISYHELARQYGDIKAIRAVASATGRNNLAVIVPCHRVIGSDLSLVGYAGGLWRKKWLLEHEAKYFHGIQELAFPSDESSISIQEKSGS